VKCTRAKPDAGLQRLLERDLDAPRELRGTAAGSHRQHVSVGVGPTECEHREGPRDTGDGAGQDAAFR
jgi:hypothetical protein